MTYDYPISGQNKDTFVQSKPMKIKPRVRLFSPKERVFNPKEIEEAARSTREMVERIRSHSIISKN
ncbi:MAG: hypothetical protein F6K41_19445 [Symploca sp. SIO3E6]|nr:hypothetical protein [Caldora sp. SIO3E6]